MEHSGILELAMQSLILMLQLSLPPILVASLAGLLVSLFQAITQLQEQTLAFGIKLIAVGVTIMLMAGWLGGEIYNYSMQIFSNFHHMVP
jgi:type III secretion protein, HrpO family